MSKIVGDNLVCSTCVTKHLKIWKTIFAERIFHLQSLQEILETERIVTEIVKAVKADTIFESIRFYKVYDRKKVYQ